MRKHHVDYLDYINFFGVFREVELAKIHNMELKFAFEAPGLPVALEAIL